jgi:hypothetical protein
VLLVTVTGTGTQVMGALLGPATDSKAPIAASGEHVYVIWDTDKPGNWEIMFRASHDGGRSFDDKINLSQNPDADSLLLPVAQTTPAG